MTLKNQKMSCVHGLEDLILLKCLHYPKQSITSCNSYQNTNGIFFTKGKNPKTNTESPKNKNSQNNEKQC